MSHSQTRILVQPFTKDLLLGTAIREELARQTGIPDLQTQVSSPPSTWAQDMAQEKGVLGPAERLELDTHRLGLGLGLWGRGPKVGLGPIVAVQASLISQGQEISLQKMALQK